MIVMSTTEKEIIREAMILLKTGTCNSLFPENREGWNKVRDRVVERLREMSE